MEKQLAENVYAETSLGIVSSVYPGGCRDGEKCKDTAARTRERFTGGAEVKGRHGSMASCSSA